MLHYWDYDVTNKYICNMHIRVFLIISLFIGWSSWEAEDWGDIARIISYFIISLSPWRNCIEREKINSDRFIINPKFYIIYPYLVLHSRELNLRVVISLILEKRAKPERTGEKCWCWCWYRSEVNTWVVAVMQEP